ncbi:MAG: urease accessory protein UreD [Pseudomonadota bacterium]
MTALPASPDPIPPRAIGAVRLSTKPGPGGTVIDGLYQQGSAKAVFPRAPRGLTAVLLNTSGGVTGGDHFEYDLEAGAGTHLTVTTQACERAYRAMGDVPGRVETSLRVAADATLWWLPQETLLFDGCHLHRHLRCDLATGARALLVEPVCFGRLAMGETRLTGTITDRIALTRNGAPLVYDGWHLSGDITAQMQGAAVGGGAAAMAALILVAPEAEAHLDPVRAHLGADGGASLLAPDVLVMRVLARDGYGLRARLLPILDHLTGGALPLCWRL